MQQYIMFSIGKTHEKNFSGPNFWVKTGQNRAWSLVFCHFLKFGSLVFLDIALDCSLGQCLTSSRDEISKKKKKEKKLFASWNTGNTEYKWCDKYLNKLRTIMDL